MNDITIQNEGETLDGVELALKAIAEARQSARKPKIAPATTAIPPEHADLQAALNAIPAGAKLEKHSASTAIGYGLRHAESGIPEDIGRALAAQWDQRTGGAAVSVFNGANPFYNATQPVTTGSIYKLARQCGWTGRKTSQEWGTPAELPTSLPPVDPFDYELLPEALRPWVADIAERMQCPPDFSAVSAVVALSSLIGARAVIQPKAKDDWAVVPNLWGMAVGRPGVMKSPAINQVISQLKRLEIGAREAWEPLHKEWRIQSKAAEVIQSANESEAKKNAVKNPGRVLDYLRAGELAAAGDEPQARRFMVNDSTVEKLAEILEYHPFGLLVYRDELHGLLRGMDKQGQEGARAFYLQGFDGNQGYAVDRIIRGSHYIPRVCIAMLGGIQPGKLQAYVRDAVSCGGADDGLLQRFGLAVWPDVSRDFNHVDRWPDTGAKQAAWEVFERLSRLEAGADGEPQTWRFSPDAQALFAEWYVEIKTEIRGDDLHPALVSHLSKYDKLIPALALVFALVDTPEGGNLIQESELLRALAWGDYLRKHAERIYSAAVMPETTGAQALLNRLKAGGVPLECGEFTARMVAQKGWTWLGTADAVHKAASLLVDYGWLAYKKSSPGDQGGRPSTPYLVHPTLIKGGADELA